MSSVENNGAQEGQLPPASESSSSAANIVACVDKELVDTKCGYTASCQPRCLQKCADPKAYLLLITLFAMVQG